MRLEPTAKPDIRLQVLHGKLRCYVNNKQVFSWRDVDDDLGSVGLIVARTGGTSSAVVFSHFVPEGNAP